MPRSGDDPGKNCSANHEPEVRSSELGEKAGPDNSCGPRNGERVEQVRAQNVANDEI